MTLSVRIWNIAFAGFSLPLPGWGAFFLLHQLFWTLLREFGDECV
jgi:hypothetical protein